MSDEEWKKRVERAVEVSTYWFEQFHAANERIKRLEEAGDAMEKRLHLRKNISDQFVYKGDAESVENWNKAKEDKL